MNAFSKLVIVIANLNHYVAGMSYQPVSIPGKYSEILKG